MTDLWPADIGDTNTNAKAPVTILREQGTLLGRRTNNIVEALVTSKIYAEFEHYFSYTFYLVAPALGDYRYHLLRVIHSVDLYPVEIDEVDEDILKELPTDMKDKDGELSADSQDTFMEILKAIFATNTTLSFSRSSPRFYLGLLIRSQLRKLGYRAITQNLAQKR